jgi:hypothetical protein
VKNYLRYYSIRDFIFSNFTKNDLINYRRMINYNVFKTDIPLLHKYFIKKITNMTTNDLDLFTYLFSFKMKKYTKEMYNNYVLLLLKIPIDLIQIITSIY